MTRTYGLIRHLRVHQPATWSLVKLAQTQGLIRIDPQNETLTLEAEFGYRYPYLYDSLCLLIEEWDLAGAGLGHPIFTPASESQPIQ